MNARNFQKIGLALVLASLFACATDQGTINSKVEPKANLVFIDIGKFDSELHASLSQKSEPIVVSFYDPVSPNGMPERLQKWLTSVERTGGKVEIEPPANEFAPKDPLLLISLFSGLWSSMKTITQIQDEQVLRAAKGRTAVISLERNAAKQLVVSKVTFVKAAN
ncbi:hypothetical protein B9Z35_06035 [Limnohabitans sp. Jir61]|uniref:hypothetical protein n=1 Tax=Limnohabitans sp. Jir61 TaxID=1826168 RepID=UPI000D3815FA|nr:hypothetical protein [Limnohabitans sp. Jir61]PUE33078.1 hypothetical protein B9Z35_06035 [Limnohabitans sp. Jir61]